MLDWLLLHGAASSNIITYGGKALFEPTEWSPVLVARHLLRLHIDWLTLSLLYLAPLGYSEDAICIQTVRPSKAWYPSGSWCWFWGMEGSVDILLHTIRTSWRRRSHEGTSTYFVIVEGNPRHCQAVRRAEQQRGCSNTSHQMAHRWPS